MTDQAHQDWLSALFKRTARGIKFGNEVVLEALDRLDITDCARTRIIVAGTNGKGSTSTALSAISTAAGLRTGLFTSPHLFRFSERFRINDQEAALSTLFTIGQTVDAIEGELSRPLTFFEFSTVLAHALFRHEGVEVAIFEVGLGGRLDATNAISSDLAVITPIGLDHQSYLGDTLDLIAREKAAVLPYGGVTVVAPQSSEAEKVITATAETRTTQVRKVPAIDNEMCADMNVRVAAAAATELTRFEPRVTQKAIEDGLKRRRIRGRYERHDLKGVTVLFDTAHNLPALEALTTRLKNDDALTGPACVVASLLNDRGPEVLKPLQTLGENAWLCPVISHRSRTETELQTFGWGQVVSTMDEAFEAAATRAKEIGGYVLVTGSNMLVGPLLATLTNEPTDGAVDG